MSRDYSGVVTACVMLRFQGRRCTGAPSATIPQYYTKAVPIGTAGILPGQDGAPNSVKVFHDYALACFNAGGSTPTNQSALDALALQVAKDYYNWRSVAFDQVVSGIIAPDMDGITDETIYTYDVDDCYSRVMTGPYNGEPEELYHTDGTAQAGCVDTTGVVVGKTPCLEYYGPPATCSGSILQVPRFKLCLIDGRLQSTYVQTDNIS